MACHCEKVIQTVYLKLYYLLCLHLKVCSFILCPQSYLHTTSYHTHLTIMAVCHVLAREGLKSKTILKTL